MFSDQSAARDEAPGLTRWLESTRHIAGAPTPEAADAEQVAEFESRLGAGLDARHRRYLLAQNGWEPAGRAAVLAGGLRIASMEQLAAAPRTYRGPVLEGLAGQVTRDALLHWGISNGTYIVVAMDGFYGASFLMPIHAGAVGPEVVTVAGWIEEDTFVGDVYPSFDAFLSTMADQSERNAKNVLEREAKEARAREVWHSEPVIALRGLPEDISALATGIVAALAPIVDPYPDSRWVMTGYRWDGSADGLETLMRDKILSLPDGQKKLYVAAFRQLPGGAKWQVTISRTWPADPGDSVAIFYRSPETSSQPTPADIERIIEHAAEQLNPASTTASSTAANRAATESGIPQPTGYRVWLRNDQFAANARTVNSGEITIHDSTGGILLKAPDHWEPEQVVSEARSLIDRLQQDADEDPTDAPQAPEPTGNRLTQWLRSRRR